MSVIIGWRQVYGAAVIAAMSLPLTAQSALVKTAPPPSSNIPAAIDATADPAPRMASGVTDVSAQVRVTQNGFGRNHQTGIWTATMTVANTTNSPISGPLKVALTQLTAGDTMTNATGSYNGDPYITLPGVATLNAGQSASVPIQFNNSSNGYINYVPKTYSGVFPFTVACPIATGVVGSAYTSALVASGGVQPYTYSTPIGNLPTGLTLNTSTGAITGMPALGVFDFTAQVADSSGGPPATSPCSISSKMNQTITLDPPPPTPGTAPVQYTLGATVTSNLPITFFPDGTGTAICSISGNTLTIGTPGTCVIHAQQSGDATYYPAPDVKETFVAN